MQSDETELGKAGLEAGDQVASMTRQSKRVEAGSWSPMGHMASAKGADTKTESRARLHSKAN